TRGPPPRRPCLGPPRVELACRQARVGGARRLVGPAPPAAAADQSRRAVDAVTDGERDMSELEWLAAALVLINVALVARRSIWNYPFALVAVSLYAIVFFEAKLYSDMLLQGFFFALNIYGWWNWLRAKEEKGVPVGWLARRDRQFWMIATIAAWAAWSAMMQRFTDAAAPWADGGIAMASIAAQALLARRRV